MASFWNKAVQESKLFMSDMFVEKDLVNKARTNTLDAMEKKASDKYTNAYNDLTETAPNQVSNLEKSKEQFAKQAKDYDGKSSPWRDATDKEQARIREMAASKATIDNATPASNADAALSAYTSAIRATRLRAQAGAIGGTAKGYFANPIRDGRYGTAAARIGATAAGVGTVGAVTYSLTDGGAPDYSANYATPPSSDESQDY